MYCANLWVVCLAVFALYSHVNALQLPTNNSHDRSIDVTDLNATPPSYERLAHVGWSNLRRQRPRSDLILVAAIPIFNERVSSDWRKFRQLAMVAFDRDSRQYMRTANTNDGRNIWSALHMIPGEEQPPAILSMVPFEWAAWPITMQRAWQILRENDALEAFRSVTVRRFERRQRRVVYVFSRERYINAVTVDAHTGEFERIRLDSADTVLQDVLSNNQTSEAYVGTS